MVLKLAPLGMVSVLIGFLVSYFVETFCLISRLGKPWHKSLRTPLTPLRLVGFHMSCTESSTLKQWNQTFARDIFVHKTSSSSSSSSPSPSSSSSSSTSSSSSSSTSSSSLTHKNYLLKKSHQVAFVPCHPLFPHPIGILIRRCWSLRNSLKVLQGSVVEPRLWIYGAWHLGLIHDDHQFLRDLWVSQGLLRDLWDLCTWDLWDENISLPLKIGLLPQQGHEINFQRSIFRHVGFREG